ncbi:hypothetical protein M011DRAFT_480909 [Sporormia fimetaria CBS 119925]|uniref:Fungal calcium binding protein domain-containing protein n=1 Tax=Sporormia fimetaria CBS 119925 TaxID=1340428 RepID=A0A6A6V1Z8_9PLEO|nr:hypothetical protein M011DRAFT_480909 [Sporormia fimetaria CBS 119925]
MRFSAVAAVACMFAASVVALPIGTDDVVVGPGETETCIASASGSIADSACYKKREVDDVVPVVEEEEADKCLALASASIVDSACYKLLKRMEEDKAKREPPKQCKPPQVAKRGADTVIVDSACY